MAASSRRHATYLNVDNNDDETSPAAGPSQPSNRYSALSARSAQTADSPSTPPRAPSPFAIRCLEVPLTALPGVRIGEDGTKEKESRSLRRARSAERTRTWAEEVERQRLKAESRAGTKREILTERWADEEVSGTWAASSDVIHAIVDELNPTIDGLSHLPSADRVIANISGKSLHLGSSPSESEGSGKVYFCSSRRTSSKTQDKPPSPKRAQQAQASATETAVPRRARPSIKTRTSSRAQSPTSPRPIAQIPTQPYLPPTSLAVPKSALLSIDDIIKKHSFAVNGAFAAVTEKAKRDLGVTPSSSPVLLSATSPAMSSSSPKASPPVYRSPLSPSPASSPPARGLSLSSGRQTISAGSRARLSLEVSRPPRARASSLFKPSEEGSVSSDADILDDVLAGQALLDRLETGSTASSRRRKDSHTHCSTPPSDHFGPPTPSSHRSKRQSLPAQRKEEEGHAMAVYLRSISLNGILQLPRPYPERPLQVSLADIGSPTGIPVLFFLGIGCVRHLIALFDDLAKALNLRLICIDRWGLGRTTNVPQDKRSPLDWAGVVERVLDEINVDSVRLISHSAGAPYAAATALRLGERVKGKIHFLAPWINVDVDGGYKWLKWVPNGVIKSAFAAEWKLQSYRLGKPPPLNHRPISHIAEPNNTPERLASHRLHSEQTKGKPVSATDSLYSARTPSLARRTSQVMGVKSGGHIGSAMTLATQQAPSLSPREVRSIAPSQSHSGQSIPSRPSFGSSAQTPSASSGLSSIRLKSPDVTDQGEAEIADLHGEHFVADLSVALPTSSLMSLVEKPPTDAALLHALDQASHAECEPGTTDDLLTIILNRPARPWGFSYADLCHPATIWWGSEDERISEKSVRWMERVIPGGAELKIVPGADHNLMRSVPVMCEILESIRDEAKAARG